MANGTNVTAVTTLDPSNSLFSQEQKIIFFHEWSGTTVEFKVFDISYSESITNDWEEVVLPRRINRSYTWSGVIRKISLGWSMPAFDINEAKANLGKCSTLVKMMYPMVDATNSQITGGNPVWRLGIMNWAHAGSAAVAGAKEPDTMLAGFPDNFSFDIVAEDGFLYDNKIPYPKNIKASMGYTVLLDDSKTFGWSTTETAGDSEWTDVKSFPWADETEDLNNG
jgi:hypothetical protein